MTVKIEDLRKLENETERVSALYDIFDEGTRLSTKSTQIEFLTTIRQIEKHLRSGMRILDLGAGTGKYSIYFAKHGYEVTAVELVEKHVKEIRDRVSLDMPIQVFQGNALDLSMIEDNTYDIVKKISLSNKKSLKPYG